MTTLLLDKVKKQARAVSKLVLEAYPDLRLQYIVHHNNQRNESILIEEDALLKHPAGIAARNILNQPVSHDLSQFIGLSCSSSFRWLLFRREDHLLGLITFNSDQYNSLKDAQVDMFHEAWHAINMRMIRERPENLDKYRNRPISPKRNPVNQSRANLMADAFCAVFFMLMGEKDSISTIAKRRAENTLRTLHQHQPELYPFPIAMEATQFAYDALDADAKMTTQQKLAQAYKTSINVGKMFNAIDIHQWWGYAQPAQDMAWRKIDKMEILSAAVHTSDDPFIRSNGDLIAEILGVDSAISVDLGHQYNAFDEWEKNREKHEKLIHETFEIVIAKSIKDGSTRHLLSEANEQNKKLIHGDFIGWCASALQAAARRFESTDSINDDMLLNVAQDEFESTQKKTDLDSLSMMSSEVVNERRQGNPMSLSQIQTLAESNESYREFATSIDTTRHDAEYIKSFENENVFTPEVAPTGAKPKGPSPSIIPVMTPKAPGLGSSTPLATVQQETDEISDYKDAEEFA